MAVNLLMKKFLNARFLTQQQTTMIKMNKRTELTTYDVCSKCNSPAGVMKNFSILGWRKVNDGISGSGVLSMFEKVKSSIQAVLI